jgi:hypothetical protein
VAPRGRHYRNTQAVTGVFVEARKLGIFKFWQCWPKKSSLGNQQGGTNIFALHPSHPRPFHNNSIPSQIRHCDTSAGLCQATTICPTSGALLDDGNRAHSRIPSLIRSSTIRASLHLHVIPIICWLQCWQEEKNLIETHDNGSNATTIISRCVW